MSNKQKSSELLMAVQQILNKSNGEELSELLFKGIKKQTKIIEEFFEVQPLQATILSLFLDAGLRDHELTLNGIINHFNEKIDKVSDISDALDDLIELKLISGKTDKNLKRTVANINFSLNENVLNAFLKGDREALLPVSINNFFEFLEDFKNLFERKRNGFMDAYTFSYAFEKSINDYLNIKEISWLKQLENCTVEEIQFIMMLLVDQINGEKEIDLESILLELFYKIPPKFQFRIKLIDRTSPLFKLGLIDFCEKNMFGNDCVTLTEKAFDNLLSEGYKDLSSKSFRPIMGKLIYPEDIKEENLYYNLSESKQINSLNIILNPDNYDSILSQLQENNLVSGINILFYGNAGTGKTVTVKQIAKQTKRILFLVEIEKIKDKWVGDSEKNLKKVFEEYQKLTLISSQTPILVFNEADAVLGKRTSVNSSTDKSFNALQNILLQELEDFKGISFSTTNLPNHLDKAFERRFLYKIEFNNPSKEIQKAILSNSFISIKEDTINNVVSKFTLTGGQINNIKKKFLLQSIVEGFDDENTAFFQICDEELSFDKNISNIPIGF